VQYHSSDPDEALFLGPAAGLYALTVLATYLGHLDLVVSGVLGSGLLVAAHCARQDGPAFGVAAGALVAVLWPIMVPIYWWASHAPIRPGASHIAHGGIAGTFAVVLALAYSLANPGEARRMPANDVEARMLEHDLDTQAERKEEVLALLNDNPFSTPWWLRGPHAQSFWSPFMRDGLEVDYRSERWDTPDGDFVYVRFLDGEPDAPLVILFHGLEGSAQSTYMRGNSLRFNELGWNVAILEFRFCSGEINNTTRIYHMGETRDCDLVVRRLAERHPEKSIYLLGFSLGGNVVAKWLGENGDDVPDNLSAAAVISPPFDPLVSAPDFHRVLGGFYAWNFLRTLKPKALAKAEQYPGIIDVDAVKGCKDFFVYDTVVTAALHGFEDAEDYWRKVGSHQYLDTIRVPTLLLTSEDDPFNPPETIPREIADESPWLHPQWTKRGGHVGFVTGYSPFRVRYWAEEQTQTFFEAYEALQ